MRAGSCKHTAQRTTQRRTAQQQDTHQHAGRHRQRGRRLAGGHRGHARALVLRLVKVVGAVVDGEEERLGAVDNVLHDQLAVFNLLLLVTLALFCYFVC
jgi:hypothetical protein